MTNVIGKKYSCLVLVFTAILFIEIVYFENYFDVSVSLYDKKGLLKSGFYFCSVLVSSLAISLIVFVNNRIIYVTLITIASFSYFITMVYIKINGYGIGLNELNIALSEAAEFKEDVWAAYSSAITSSLIVMLGSLVLVFIFRKHVTKTKKYIHTVAVLFVWAISLLTSYTIFSKTVGSVSAFPIPVKIVNTVTYFASNRSYYGDRDELLTYPNGNQAYDNILWIVDESVGGQYLSINGYKKDTTPYLNSIRSSYLNMGIASSTANCSAMSNIMLMSGIQLAQLPDKEYRSLKTPSIFQFARNAGYMTHYISGQSSKDKLQNHMTAFDKADIDNFYQPSAEYNQRDIPEENVIEHTYEALLRSKKNFIYIVKRGAHFHWEENGYPASKKIFKPTLEVADSLVQKNREKALNSYANSIRYNVDEFFKEFFDRTGLLNSKRTLIFYTSDHGQSILENGKTSTHCDSKNPEHTQGIVPFIIFKWEGDELFKGIEKSNFTYSHYQIFPTTVRLMGYARYDNGEDIFSEKNTEQVFFSGDLFGRVPFMITDIAAEQI